MSNKLLIFDLDGTLADTSLNIIQAVHAAMEKVELTPLPFSVISILGDSLFSIKLPQLVLIQLLRQLLKQYQVVQA